VRDPPAGQVGPLGQPDQSGSRAGKPPGRTGSQGAARQGVRGGDGEAVTGRPAHRHGDRLAGGVLAGVGEGLLHDPVRVPTERGRHGAEIVGHVQVDAGTGLAGLLDQGGQVVDGRLGFLVVGLAQHPDHLSQVLQGVVGALPDHPGGVAFGLGGVAAHLQRPGVHGQQRDSVGEDVVHLPGDAFAFAVPGLLDAQPLTLLGLAGPVGPGPHEPPVRAHQHRDRHDDDVQQRHDHHGLDVDAGLDGCQAVGQGDGEAVQDGHPHGDRPPAVHPHREQRDREGTHRQPEQHAHRDQDQRESHRPGPPEEHQRGERHHAGGDLPVDHRGLTVRGLVGDRGPQEEHADQRGEDTEPRFPDDAHAPTLPVAGMAGMPPTVDDRIDFGRRRSRPVATARLGATQQTEAMIEKTTSVQHPWWLRPAVWLGPAAAGAGLLWLLKLAAGWLAGVSWVPMRAMFRLIASLWEPHATIGACVVGAALGLVLAHYVDQELLTVRVTRTEVTLARPGVPTVVVQRAAVATAFADAERLVLLGRSGEEVARQPCHLSTRRLSAAFAGAGIAWAEKDPYEDAYRRWVPDTDGLPVGANALFAARERALKACDTDDVSELRGELGRLGVVVRDASKRQYWRLTSTGSH
jgi:hypothetical protein